MYTSKNYLQRCRNYTIHASARDTGDKFYYNLLKHMLWWLQGLQWTLQNPSHHFGCLTQLICLTILLIIPLHNTPIVSLAKINHHTIWTKVSWQWYIMELSQQFLIQTQIFRDHTHGLSTILPAHQTIWHSNQPINCLCMGNQCLPWMMKEAVATLVYIWTVFLCCKMLVWWCSHTI